MGKVLTVVEAGLQVAALVLGAFAVTCIVLSLERAS